MIVHVEVTQEDQFCSFPGRQHDCMVHRAILRALGKQGIHLASEQLEVNGSNNPGENKNQGWFLQILSAADSIYLPAEYEREDVKKLFEDRNNKILETWNLSIPSAIWWFDWGNNYNLHRPDVAQWITDFDNGYEVPEFNFDFSLRQQMTLNLDWIYRPVAQKVELEPVLV